MATASRTNDAVDVVTTPIDGGSTILPADVLTKLDAMLAQCPREAEGPGYAGMIDAILSAETLDDLAAATNSDRADVESTKDVAGVSLRIDGFVLRDSEYAEPGSFPYYATVEAYEVGGKNAGAARTFNSGSVQVVGALATAHARGLFPLLAHVNATTIKKSGRTVYSLTID
jgi:hypothetical protein